MQHYKKENSKGAKDANDRTCGVIGKVVVENTSKEKLAAVQLVAADGVGRTPTGIKDRLLLNLTNWCFAFNNFSHQDALNGITNGKLIHLISVIYSFVILTFMNQFYSDHASQAAIISNTS